MTEKQLKWEKDADKVKMDEKTKRELREMFNIKSVGGGQWGEGFYDCLQSFADKHIELFKQDHIIKRIEFAKKNNLPYDWLINQLRNDGKRK
jgi:hypothetical protein